MTKFLAALGKCDYIKLNNTRYGFWDFLEHQPDGWLLSLAFNHAIVPPVEHWCIKDCGAYSYRNLPIPMIRNQIVNAAWAIAEYKERSLPGDMVIAPDQMLIDDIEYRRQFNITEAAEFIKLAQSQLPGRKPMAVCHGIDIKERIESAKQLIDMGYNAIAIGGIAINGKEIAKNLEIIAAVKSSVPKETWIHVLGLCAPEYISKFAKLGINSCDGSTHVREAIAGQFIIADGVNLVRYKATKYREKTIAPLCNCKVCWKLREHDIDTRTFGSNQHNLGRAIHNLNELIKAQRCAMGLGNKIALVACVSQKLDYPAAAKDLYQSQWFKAARKYVEQEQIPWYILSAKYGVVHPDRTIAPYDETLNNMPIEQRRQWGDRVFNQLTSLGIAGSDVIILAGKKYREFIIPALSTISCNSQVPMEHLGIGQQIQWLQAQLSIDAKVSHSSGDNLANIDTEANFSHQRKLLTNSSGDNDDSYAPGKYVKLVVSRKGWRKGKHYKIVEAIANSDYLRLQNDANAQDNGFLKDVHVISLDKVSSVTKETKESDIANDSNFNPDAISYIEFIERIKTWLTHHCHDSVFNEIDLYWEMELRESCCKHFIQTCGENFNLTNFNKAWESVILELCPNLIKPSISTTSLSSTPSLERDAALESQQPNSISESLDLLKSMNSVMNSSASDSLELATTEMSIVSQESMPPSLVEVHHVNRSVLMENGSVVSTSAMDSQHSSDLSKQVSQLFSCLRMSLDCSLVPTLQTHQKARTLLGYKGSFPASGTIWNGLLYPLECLKAPGLVKDFLWLESPGALSYSGKTNPPGGDKLSECLRGLGILSKGFVPNADFVEKAFNLPDGWTNPSLRKAAMELIEVADKSSVTRLIGELLSWDSCAVSIGLESSVAESTTQKVATIEPIETIETPQTIGTIEPTQTIETIETIIPNGTRVYSDRLISANSFKGKDYREALDYIKSLAATSHQIISHDETNITIRLIGIVVGNQTAVVCNPNHNHKPEPMFYYKVRWDGNQYYCYIKPQELHVIDEPNTTTTNAKPNKTPRHSPKGNANGWIEKQTKYKVLANGNRVEYDYYYFRWQVRKRCFGKRIPNELIELVKTAIAESKPIDEIINMLSIT